ncbi:MAG: hypothetical protein RIQ60_4510 [Pseudomonadota bacterium]|jgi:uncharacterized membrane protein YkvA (DUF1232 family)
MSALKRFFRRFAPADLAVRLLALAKLLRHPATPWPARAVAALVLIYVASPIDLIPDFIPLIGQLDDLLLVPLGLALAVRLAPAPLWQLCLAQARLSSERLPRWLWAGAAVLLVWALLLGLFVMWLWRQATLA